MRKLTALLLALALCLGLTAPAGAAYVTDDDVIRAVLVVFRRQEGSYDSVNPNDNGALSIGKLQWHGVRALELVKEIAAADPAGAYDLLGEALYLEAVYASRDAWNARILNAAEAARISALLATAQSTRIQDATAKKDISAYIAHARTYDIRSAEAMIYYCDLENQYGPGGAAGLVRSVKEILGKSYIENVDEFHEALTQATGYYRERRTWTWQFARSIDWSSVGVTGQGSDPLPVPVNLDVEPPVILDSRIVLVDEQTFRVELRASDNRQVTGCRVQVGTDAEAQTEWAAYCTLSGSTWVLPVKTAQLPECTHYYITATAADAAGNGTSIRLELEREVLDALRTDGGTCEHRFHTLNETAASCTAPAEREEQCEICGALRVTVLAPARGHQYELVEGDRFRCAVCGAELSLSGQDPVSGPLMQAAQKALDYYQNLAMPEKAGADHRSAPAFHWFTRKRRTPAARSAARRRR